jgi:hypothetical protein
MIALKNEEILFVWRPPACLREAASAKAGRQTKTFLSVTSVSLW